MINYNQPKIHDIIDSKAPISDIHREITSIYGSALLNLNDKPQWQTNAAALANNAAEFGRILMNKIHEMCCNDELISNSNLFEHLWMQTDINGATPQIKFNYANDKSSNILLFTINHPIDQQGHLQAENLPTIYDIQPAALPLDDNDYAALIRLIKQLYTADYHFNTAVETILQPVDGLTFNTVFPPVQAISASQEIHSNDEPISLKVNVGSNDIANYEVMVNGKNIADTGDAQLTDDGTFIWERDSDDDLADQTLTLSVNYVSTDHLPALDDLFIAASMNGILMRASDQADEYELTLPNNQILGLTISAPRQAIRLHYPEPTLHVYELIKQYDFLGEWLKGAIKN
ncbi:MAG: hypothetical protein H9901_02790 [Candidatus Paralactobacillus gallistercoris]|uniref:Uncharacterized protein n=1 Tax=Candidatus Paralactobacillus gallistercoris TaxID=2838724 RepID=A0A948TIX8_9LACO|nr:hypothetical protein [Candidatus Paralactobacillus gallistercoris]